MKKKSMLVVFVIVLGLSLSCSLFSTRDDAVSTSPLGDQESDFPTDQLNDSGMSFGENAQWPAYLPQDIPVLEGDIRVVMGMPEDPRVRIFYEPLTEKQIDQYLEQCEKAGFELDYVVYVQEGFPDRSEEKMKAGDFDAVVITKGDYRMRLEYGSDLATLDIELPRSQESRPTAVPLGWPDDIAASVPRPEGCNVRNIANLSGGGYQITCEYADGNIRLDAYYQRLLGLGFQETERLLSDQDAIVYITLENGDISVKLNPHTLSSTITLQVQPINP